MSTITKLSQDVTQYYKNITSPDRRKCENTKRYAIINCTNKGSGHKRKTLETSKGVWKDRASDGIPMIHASAAPL